MARRERPVIEGRDPEYSHQFEAGKTLPNAMPPGVKIPGLNRDGTDAGQAVPPGDGSAVAPTNEPASAPPASVETRGAEPALADGGDAATSSTMPETKAMAPAKPKAKRSRAGAAPKKTPAASGARAAAPSKAEGETRRVTIKAAITTAHVDAMAPLVAAGIAQRDVMAVAGRRAMKRFDPVAEFVPLPEGDRIALAEGYVTSKAIRADLLDGLRQAHDPLRLRSDAAMVRGQFEILFWSVLEEVIEELRPQKG